jgi:uncharacterized protein YlxW (UPF0749 family)
VIAEHRDSERSRGEVLRRLQVRRPAREHLPLLAVAVLLGVLAVGQLHGQAGVPGLSGLSAADLTQLIANLDAQNGQLRNEVATLNRQESDLAAASSRGETTVGELRSDLERIRGWSGVTGLTGPGVLIDIRGPIGGDAVEDLLNEVRNAGAEGIAVEDVRMVTGLVVAGPPGALSVENTPLGDSFEIQAIGSPEILTGTLTRTGGVIAQIGATYPGATITVTPTDVVRLPPTTRDLTPGHAQPRL